MKTTLLIAIGLGLVASAAIAAKSTFQWDGPVPPGVHHVRFYGTTNVNWQTATNVFWSPLGSVTNPPTVPWTNRLTLQVSQKVQVVIPNVPDTFVAGRAGYVYTNGVESAADTEALFRPKNLIYELE